ncbi:hypothetical protein V5799_034023 [Amblyomma americanum]|uniref:Uncharacterized protein n=1 Tax=Amblyomma americanum TaxID=6943 RepID=A0AAQ4DLM8_AMBAM
MPKTFDSRIYHQVKWTDAEGEADFYPARILMLGGSSRKKWSLNFRTCTRTCKKICVTTIYLFILIL